MTDTIEIDGQLYHARDGEPLREDDGSLIPAHICLCFAHDEYECGCGAWDRPIPEKNHD